MAPRSQFRRGFVGGAVTLLMATVCADNTTSPVSMYLSRPDIQAPAMNVTVQNTSAWEPGYVFIAPYGNAQPGPYIYDKYGNLVWSGYSVAGAGVSQNMQLCTYNGSNHICMVQGNQLNGYQRGQGMILNSNYQTVQSMQVGNSFTAADQHEFLLFTGTGIHGGDSALMASYQPTQYDLSAYNVTGGQGYITDSGFQEVDVATGQILFEWKALNRVSPSDSLVLPGTTDISGNGSYSASWDYFHINAIDKSPTYAAYVVSGRHTSSLYYVNATDGSTIWTLSCVGKYSDYTCSNFNFGYQHDASFISDNSSMTILSIYDNASNGFATTANYSAGKIIAVDHTTGMATLLQEYPIPDGLLSSSQGNFQFLPNGNVFLGMGSWPSVAEFTADGTLVFSAALSASQDLTMSYRAFSVPWTSTPANTVPALYVYSQSASAPTAAYVSWNGATEVASWRFYGTQDPAAGPWTVVAEVAKAGFETVFVSEASYAWMFAEALDGRGNSLRNSTYVQAFVPSAALAGACDAMQCVLAKGAGDVLT